MGLRTQESATRLSFQYISDFISLRYIVITMNTFGCLDFLTYSVSNVE